MFSITEQSGLADSITAYVLQQAVTCSLRWRAPNGEAFPININESPASFVTRSLVEQWRARLAQVGLHESQITLKLTPASLNNKPGETRVKKRADMVACTTSEIFAKGGLTEEFLSQGENDKGGHETEAMRNHYRLIKPPKRARTTIRFEREQKTP